MTPRLPHEERAMPHSIPRAHLKRLVVDKASAIKPNVRFQRKAVRLLQQALEDYLAEVFRRARQISGDDDKKTLTVRDFHLAVEALRPAPKLVLKVDPSDEDTAVFGLDDEGSQTPDADTSSA